MESELYKTIVPGSLMLMGEHAVLYGKPALVCAVNKYITVSLQPRKDRLIFIHSHLGRYEGSLDNLPIIAPFTFVLTAIHQEIKNLSFGFNFIIEDDFSYQIGIGSSAAVTVAVLAALKAWQQKTLKIKKRKNKSGCTDENGFNLHELFLAARKVIRRVQGFGSGADVAASIWGGVVAYQASPIIVKRIADFVPLVVVYSGMKVPTKEVVSQVEARRRQMPKIFAQLDSVIASCTKEAKAAIKNKDWPKLGLLTNVHQGLHEALGVNTLTLDQIIFALRKQPDIYGAKISGSGMGDCVIGIGQCQEFEQEFLGKKQPWNKLIDVKVSALGVIIK